MAPVFGDRSDINPSSPAGAGRSAVVAAEDAVAVVDARRLRRRLRVAGGILKVVLVLGGLGMCGAVALIPNGLYRPCRAQQSEAKGNLKALYVANESHRAEHDVYSDDFAAMGYRPIARGEQRYRYVVTDLVPSSTTPPAGRDAHFLAWAFSVGDDDVWTISEANDLTVVVDSCR